MGYRRDGNDRAGWDGWCWGSPATSRTAPEDVRRVLCHAAVDGACGGRVDRACGIVEPTAWRASLCSVPVRCNTCAHITSRNFIVLQYRCVQTTLSTVSQRILTKIHSVSFRCYSVIMKNAARVIFLNVTTTGVPSIKPQLQQGDSDSLRRLILAGRLRSCRLH